MLIVKDNPDAVEADLQARRIACPRCSGQLAPHGYSSERELRTLDGVRRLRPRRAKCSSCGVTQVFEPASTIPRLRDTAEVIGAAWLAKASGTGHRAIAAHLGRPVSTVRRWLRRLEERSATISRQAVSWLCEVEPSNDLRCIDTTTGSPLADALEHVGRVAKAVSLRVRPMPPWEAAVALTGGLVTATGSYSPGGP